MLIFPSNLSLWYINYYYAISAVVFEDKAVTTATNQEIQCIFSELSQDSKVTWIGPDNSEISDSDASNYVIDQGLEFFGNKASTLTITTAKLASLTSGDVFKCKLKSAKYPVASPEVVKEMTLTLLSLGKFNVVFAEWYYALSCCTANQNYHCKNFHDILFVILDRKFVFS
jgi:hypothetical protein